MVDRRCPDLSLEGPRGPLPIMQRYCFLATIHIASFSHLNGVTLEHLAASTIANRNASTSLSHRAKAMNIFNYSDVKTILVCGDIHGNPKLVIIDGNR